MWLQLQDPGSPHPEADATSVRWITSKSLTVTNPDVNDLSVAC